MAAEEAVLRSADATAAEFGADSTAAAMCDLRLGTIRMGARFLPRWHLGQLHTGSGTNSRHGDPGYNVHRRLRKLVRYASCLSKWLTLLMSHCPR